ncbi:hypothetical protein K2173_014684 [Erythroxylum novogranatense]|uniref:rhamnogalacturonan endolyase n=1 Tax=Erythroxylum novogranatense TaxID=1862640 RepID=A0AAV8TF97_9ROSI|nr:hypothetical protein K2173_014684 [Erythroxylum novogranatense]
MVMKKLSRDFLFIPAAIVAKVVIDNGIVQITLAKPSGYVTGVKYGGIPNLLETRNKPSNRGYIVQRGSAGFYTYAIFEHLEGWPDFDLDFFRMVFKPQNNKFHYMAISDDIQRVMPTPSDTQHGHKLAYKEATLVNGEVDDKYMYSMENKDHRVKGWISNDPPVGFWMITPTDEYFAGGPTKQDLTSHVGPTVLAIFHSDHYVNELSKQFRDGEAWKKVYGPIFIYLNSNNYGDNQTLWNDAKRQTSEEINKWPYDFVQSEEFLPSYKRGTVNGHLAIKDSDAQNNFDGASYAYVGLASPGEAGSWQFDIKGYQFWTRANRNGDFQIKNVRPGIYNLYAWVPGFVGDYKYSEQITIEEGSEVKLDDLRFETPRNGPTLWEIGIPDRSAAEFFIPDPSPDLQNKVFLNKPQHRYRQYGLWSRYTDLYPENDLVYNIGSSNHTRDWFYAHVPRLTNGNYQPTTWQINFELYNVEPYATYTLQLALASSNYAHLNVRLNNQLSPRPLFTTGGIGKDNAVARDGIHGIHRLYTFEVPSRFLVNGQNALYLQQARGSSPFQGMMYDYIRLEGPSSSRRN